MYFHILIVKCFIITTRMKTTQLQQTKKITKNYKRLQFAVGCGIHNKNNEQKRAHKK